MKKFILLLIIGGAAYFWIANKPTPASQPQSQQPVASVRTSSAGLMFGSADAGKQVITQGTVCRILPDDNEGRRHQRFLIQLKSGQTILVAHNIDLASRVSPLAVGDKVLINGQYECNDDGGVIHWTHRDPRGRHQPGWIKRGTDTFE